jgi:predicted metal-dependent hydrolase
MISQLELGDVSVDVELKDIKNIHLSVLPPTGRVRISAPSRMSLDAIRVFAISKLGWIRQQQRKLREQERETPREYLDRESHFVWGQRYLLRVLEENTAPRVALKPNGMILRVRPGTTEKAKQSLVARWYRDQIKAALPGLLAKWQPILNVKVKRVFVQKMKTRWGSCNPMSMSIRLNTDLAKKPPECIEYIVVHELLHLRVRHHDDEFSSLMDRFLPHWRMSRQILNSAPLGHVAW